MEGGAHPCRKVEGDRWSQGALDGESRTTGTYSSGGPQRAAEARSRGREAQTPRSGEREEEGQERKRFRRERKEGERKERQEDQSSFREEGSGRDLWRDWLRPRWGGETTVSQKGPKDQKRQQKEEKEVGVVEPDQRRLRQLQFRRRRSRSVFRSSGYAENLEKSTRGAELHDSSGGATDPAHQARFSAGRANYGTTRHHGPVLQGQSPRSHDPCIGSGNPPLVYHGGFDAPGRTGQGMRSSVPKDQSPRKLCKRGSDGGGEDARAGAAGEDVPYKPGGSKASWSGCLGGGKGPEEDKRGRKKQRHLYPLDGWKERERQRRWQKQEQARWEVGSKRQGGSEVQRLLGEGEKVRQSRSEVKKGGEQLKEREGVPGGIGSQTMRRKVNDACDSSGQATVGSTAVFSNSACLPKGSAKDGIHSEEKFEDVMKSAWDVFQKSKRSMLGQWTTAEEHLGNAAVPTDVFPLPISPADSDHFSYVIHALNDLAGAPYDTGHHGLEQVHETMKKELKRIVERFDVFQTPKPEVSFKKLFSTKDIDYTGEEIKIAQSLSWQAVQQSLPDGVGRLPLQEFCRLGTLEYITNFEQHLHDPADVQVPSPPRVMVENGSWFDLCKGLVEKNICEIWPIDHLYHHSGEPLLNGMFAVGKGEFQGNVETQRLIMNLTPLNSMCKPLAGDVSTLPGLSGFSGFLLEKDEVALFSSEDIRCFFYLFSVPEEWKRYLGFNREVDSSLVPLKFRGKRCVLVSRVLPMGFVNSVSIAQHIHRNVVRWSAAHQDVAVGGQCEMRKDKAISSSSTLFRVYLDNFDQVEKTDPCTADLIKGTPSAQILQLRQDYAALGLPRHPKKGVERQMKAEIQGALFDGAQGYAVAKPEKIWQYALLGLELLKRGQCTLKELQVVCGGFVYMAMFRRPLLGVLNQVWAFMQTFNPRQGSILQRTPRPVEQEIARFILLIPLAQMDFRADLCEQISCSDASTSGGGICVSEGLTAYGVHASNSQVRGDIPEEHDLCQVLTVGLFDGISALRMAADVLGLPVAGHVSIEKDSKGRRVVESWFPDTTFFDDVVDFGEEQVKDLALRYSNVGVVVLGAGPPCQGVSGLNADKKGALLDERSSLFQEVPRIHSLFVKHFPWAQVHRLMESVASMSPEDRQVMTTAAGTCPYKIDCFGLTLCHRPRLYWVTWELVSEAKAMVSHPVTQTSEGLGMVSFFVLDPGRLLGPPYIYNI